jgi:hypothetical protein
VLSATGITSDRFAAAVHDFTTSAESARPATVDADAVVGYDDTGTLRGEKKGVTAADASPRPRDDHHPVVKTQFRHQSAGASNRTGTDVGDRKA